MRGMMAGASSPWTLDPEPQAQNLILLKLMHEVPGQLKGSCLPRPPE